jgi:antitoxin component YwqK of YwqJK toxin-antitoxin module/membrane-associated protease RseP (regulator of RpoE activity)
MKSTSGKTKDSHADDILLIVFLSAIVGLLLGGIVGYFGGTAWGLGVGVTGAFVFAVFLLQGKLEEERAGDGEVDEDGFRHGLWTVKYPNGDLQREQHYDHGVNRGRYKSWHENGQQESEGDFREGKPHGTWTYWYENGQKRTERHYHEGALQGTSTAWYETGKRKSETDYVNDKPKGASNEWYENGQIHIQANYHDEDMRHGDWLAWHENGQKWFDLHYVYGTPHGTWTEWDNSGRKRCEAQFIAGIQHGRGIRGFPDQPDAKARKSGLGRYLYWLLLLVVGGAAIYSIWGLLLLVSFIVAVHELGHFAAAKSVGIPIKRFVVGFGPRLFAFRFRSTEYELRLIPLMGCVQEYDIRERELEYYRATIRSRQKEVSPEYPDIEPSVKPQPSSEYFSRPRRLVFLSGGVSFNLLAAIAVVWATLPSDGPDSTHFDWSIAQATQIVLRATWDFRPTKFLSSIQASDTDDRAKTVTPPSADGATSRSEPADKDTEPSSSTSSGKSTSRSVTLFSLGPLVSQIVLLSIFVVWFNLLPIPPLDGFGVFRVTLEMLLRRDIPNRYVSRLLECALLRS